MDVRIQGILDMVVASADELLAGQDKNIADLQAQVQDLDERNQTLIATVSDLNAAVDKLQTANTSLQAQLAALPVLPQILQPTILTDIERNPARGATGWNFATDHAVTATAPHTNGTITPQSDGWTDFVITPAMPYDNTYYYFQCGPRPLATRFAWGATVSISDADIPRCQAWEWEFEQTINGRFFNMGWQCLFSKADGGPAWRYFDKVNHHWIKTQIPLDLGIFAGGKPVTVLAEYHKPDADHIQFDALTVNGTRYPLTNIINPPEDQTLKDPTKVKTNFLHYSFQQDPVQQQGWKIRVQKMQAMYL